MIPFSHAHTKYRDRRGLGVAQVLGYRLNVFEFQVISIVEFARQDFHHPQQREREIRVSQDALVVQQIHQKRVVIALLNLKIWALIWVFVESVKGHCQVLDLARVICKRTPATTSQN